MTASNGRPRRTPGQLVVYVARRAVEMEIGVWQSLYRFVFRRPRVPTGAVGFPYHQPVLGILLVFVVLSAVEIVVLDVIVHRWAAIRIPLLVVGAWGLTWMLGLLFGYLTRPHAVGPDGLRIRSGSEIDIPIAWTEITEVRRRRHTVDSTRAARVTTTPAGTTLHLRMQYDTNVVVTLTRPVPARLPSGTVQVDEVRFWVDDDRAFVAAVERFRPAQESRRSPTSTAAERHSAVVEPAERTEPSR